MNLVDLCDLCVRQEQGCTISAGRTATCGRFREKIPNIDKRIRGGGEICCCGQARFERFARHDKSTDGLNLHYDICPACGFETYAHAKMAVKQERYNEWRANMENHGALRRTK